MTEDKVATLTSDIKRNYVNDEDISRAYILHEKDLYSLVILALKGVRSKSLSETNKTTNDKEVSQEKSVKSTQTKPSPEDETLPPETLAPDMKGGNGLIHSDNQVDQDQKLNEEMKDELKNILQSDFFSIDAKEFLINDLLRKLRRDKTLSREREMARRTPPSKIGYWNGSGNCSADVPDSKIPVTKSIENATQEPRNENLAQRIKMAMKDIRKVCQLNKKQNRHLKQVSQRIVNFLSMQRGNRFYSKDSKFFFQGTYIKSGTVRIPLVKVLAVFALDRSLLFQFLSSKGKVSKFSGREKLFLRNFSKTSDITCHLI